MEMFFYRVNALNIFDNKMELVATTVHEEQFGHDL